MLISKRNRYIAASILDVVCLVIIIFNAILPAQRFLAPLISPLKPLNSGKGGYEVFGFAPYWTFDKLSNVDFNVLTTFAYFGVPVLSDGSLDKNDVGYTTFESRQATDLFKRAHASGTRVVLTLTQMDNSTIENILNSSDAENQAITQAVETVKDRGIDGINLDFEYQGNPGPIYRDKFSQFVKDLSYQMHQSIPQSQVTVSVYASSMKDPKIYDISSLSKNSDGIFMMAYDFAVAGSQAAIPTDPLYGYQDGKYWYDISTAVSDFLKVMPADKLILGVPYYGYNYAVNQPTVEAATYPWASSTQMYSYVTDNINPNMGGVVQYQSGWDSDGEVGWKAYQEADTGVWRMIFLDDPKSLSIKYDFAKSKNLKGVGIWALGFDGGKQDLLSLLSSEFGTKYADSSVINKTIND